MNKSGSFSYPVQNSMMTNTFPVSSSNIGQYHITLISRERQRERVGVKLQLAKNGLFGSFSKNISKGNVVILG